MATRHRTLVSMAGIIALAALLGVGALVPGPDPATADHGGPTVTGVTVSSAPSGGAYAIGETIEVTLTFSEAVNVDTSAGAPRLQIDMDPADWGTKWTAYARGSGTTELVFVHTVVEPNYSTQGIAVLANTLELNGGTIRSASGVDAHLAHAGLAHDANHKVNWQLPPPGAPAVTGVAVTSSPAYGDNIYRADETIRVRLTFNQAVDVDTTNGTPRLTIKMDPAYGEKQAGYESGSGTAELTFAHRVAEPNYSSQGIAVLAGTLELNGGTIRSEAGADADLEHAGLGHDANHRVDAGLVTTNRAPVVNRDIRNYDLFVEHNNAPRGVLVSKEFHGIFSDPDGDQLTYAVSITAGDSRLVELLHISEDGRSDARAAQSDVSLAVLHRVWFRAEAASDWKAITPPLPERPLVTVTLTATDPQGLSASVSGDFLTAWENRPVPVGAAANAATLRLTFDQDVKGNPTPGQFTVWAVNADGSSGAIKVTGVTVNGAVVQLKLASAIEEGQTVTLDYAHNPDTPLQRAARGDAHVRDFSGQAVALASGEPAESPTVTGVAISSNAGGDDTYALGETIQVTVTFSEAVDVTGAPRLRIDLDPMAWEMHYGFVPAFLLETNADSVDLRHVTGLRYAAYHSGSGSDRLTFTYDVVEPDISTAGVAVLGSSLVLNGGVIQSASTWVDADPAHPGLAHDLDHQVDWRLSPVENPTSADDGQLVDGSETAPANRAPECTTAETWDLRYAAPLVIANYQDVICSDPDGDTLEYTISSDRPAVSKWIAYDASDNRLRFQAWGHCDLKDITPALPSPFVTTVTVTATDPEGASASGKAYFQTHYLGSYGLLHGCPHLTDARVHTAVLTLTFDVELDKDSVPAAGDFVVKVDGAAVALAESGAVRVDDKTVTLRLAAEVGASQALTLSYAPGRNPIADRPLYGAVHARAFEDVPVLNVTPAIGATVALESTPGEDADADGVNDTYGLGETISVRVTFPEAVYVDTASGTPRLRIKMDPSYGEKWAAYAGGSGTATLTFSHTVAEPNLSTRGIAVPSHSLDLNGGSIRTAAGVDAVLGHAGLAHDAGHRVDWRLTPPPPPPPPAAPALTGAMAVGTLLNLTFDQALQASPAPATGQFSVRVVNSDGSTGTVSVESVAVNGATVALTLASALGEGQTATLDYTHADASPLRGVDDGSPHARDFRAQAFDLTLADTLQVRILANVHSPRVGRTAGMTALIANAPSGETPAYRWEFQWDEDWFVTSRTSRAAYTVMTMRGESEVPRAFRLTVTYPSGASATSPVLNIVWTR